MLNNDCVPKTLENSKYLRADSHWARMLCVSQSFKASQPQQKQADLNKSQLSINRLISLKLSTKFGLALQTAAELATKQSVGLKIAEYND